MERIKQGSIIRGSYWRGPVEVKLIEQSGKYIHIIGSTTPICVPLSLTVYRYHLVELGFLALGLAGWPLELEVDTRGSYRYRPSYAFCNSPPFSSANGLTSYLDQFSGGRPSMLSRRKQQFMS